ncbi:unnamed protein product [Cuscuta europaea]|uniref:Uncharacterized protein n=1 Tax=Cuscuta europaea TaxID=41803 RepID=A0A9P1E9N1_CUSEU|nr:unnamed protein product [Cuscuta europaea]
MQMGPKVRLSFASLGFMLSLSASTQHSSSLITKGSSFSSVETISYPSIAVNLRTRRLPDLTRSLRTTTSPTKLALDLMQLSSEQEWFHHEVPLWVPFLHLY